MRLLLATLSHETNTFSPVPTKLERFCRDGTTLLSGQAAIDFYRGTGTCMGGYLAVADEIGAEVVVPVCASAPPSGPVDSDAYETCCRMITDAVAQGGFDALWLDLHGAMVTDRFDDGEGELLRRIRAIDPNTPICVAYDMHANFFDAMVSNAQIVTGYQTYPHIDQRQTAERAARALLRVMRGEVRPTAAWGAAPMLPHVMAQGTHQAPNKDLQAMCAAWESSGRALAASLFVGFPHADVEMAGLSAVVVTDNDPADAQAMVDELISAAWKARREFMFDIEPLEASVRRAKALGAPGQLPVVLLDHYDNCASGGTMDTTDTLREIIRQDLDDVVFFGIYDPDAVEQAVAGGRRRDDHAVDRREAADAAVAGGERAADCHRRGADDFVRQLSFEGRADAGAADLHGPQRRAGYRQGADRAAQPAHRADRAGDAAGARHRSVAQEIRGDQEPRALARRPGQDRARDRGMCRRRRVHVGLRATDVPQGASAGVSAGSRPAMEPAGVTVIASKRSNRPVMPTMAIAASLRS